MAFRSEVFSTSVEDSSSSSEVVLEKKSLELWRKISGSRSSSGRVFQILETLTAELFRGHRVLVFGIWYVMLAVLCDPKFIMQWWSFPKFENSRPFVMTNEASFKKKQDIKKLVRTAFRGSIRNVNSLSL